ncbi:glucokinase [Agrobacterium vitis]|uniref:glucokinase n=1 Tax=Agrobacterium vitis TaxID=373 RepID=UPI001573F514|nr:glucokinase [Agrobacterium vitis]NSZ15323.1 glucokinase [Agrobacterium vitis]QZO04193.1 glucokinase [Agrobacterium vitis]UJL89321.1 glucokinase [Agrobacterium vitis]BCH57542.1 glucokinase [Agrobacterium vitis]
MPKPHDNDHMPFPVLVGDIGGTNARFWILMDAHAAPKEFANIHTADFPTIDQAIQDCILDKSGFQPRSAILAVAGPIKDDEIPLTNCPWVIRPKAMIADLGFDDVLVVNDFEAQALAAASLGRDDREPIGPLTETSLNSRVILGPGTGLGVGGLLYTHHTWFPVPGEGGHVDIGPRSDRDWQIFPHIERIEGRISGEQILCGRGILHLYNAICAADGIAPVWTDPADVTQHALKGNDPVCVETMTLFVTYLGRIAGDMALVFMARGGVFLSGGISQKIIPLLKSPVFRAAFEDKAPHTEMMKTIPTFVAIHPQAALSGLAAYARTPSSYGVKHEGRRWQR